MSMKCVYVLEGKCYCPFLVCCVVRERRCPKLKTGDLCKLSRAITGCEASGWAHVLSHQQLFPMTNTKAVSALKLRTSGQLFTAILRINCLSPYQLPDSFLPVKNSTYEHIKTNQGTGPSFQMFGRPLINYQPRNCAKF